MHAGQGRTPVSLTQLMREAAFASKPRGRVMVYRDWLCSLSPVVLTYIAALSHKRRRELGEQMLALYALARESGTADFVAALELATEQHMYGAEYVRALLDLPSALAPLGSAQTEVTLPDLQVPAQHEVERDLAEVMSTTSLIGTSCRSWQAARRQEEVHE